MAEIDAITSSVDVVAENSQVLSEGQINEVTVEAVIEESHVTAEIIETTVIGEVTQEVVVELQEEANVIGEINFGGVGPRGTSSTIWNYKVQRPEITGIPTGGHIIWNNTTQVDATILYVSRFTDDDIIDIEIFLALIQEGNKLTVQDENNSENYQTWEVSGAPTLHAEDYIEIPVTLITSTGTGTTNFPDDQNVFFGIYPN
jgi:hypothetical protein